MCILVYVIHYDITDSWNEVKDVARCIRTGIAG